MSSSSSQSISKGVLTQPFSNVKQPVKRKHSTPKKQRGKKSPELMNFVIDNCVPSVIVKPIVSNSLTSKIPTLNSDEIFVLMLGTKNEMDFIQPIIVKTVVADFTNKEFYKCRIVSTVYVTKIISTSKSLPRLEETVPSLINKIALGWRAKIIKKDHLTVSCTKVIKFQDIQLPDQRVEFLKEILSSMDANMLCSQQKVINSSTASKMDTSSLSLDEDETDNFSHKLEEDFSENTGRSISPIVTPYVERKNSLTLNEIDEDVALHADCFELSSGSDDEKDPAQHSVRKRRKRIHTDVKLLTKLREEKRQKLDDANVQIVSLTSILNEMIPALPIDNILTPAIKNLYKFCGALNTKFNNLDNKLDQENTIPISRAINVSKVKGKDQINVNGLIFPLSAYGWACQAEEPRLVVSRLMRGCIPDSMKSDCTVNENADESNFLFRLGDDSLPNIERVANGQEQLESLIEHAHIVKKCTSMSLQSYRECKIQIDKALYDFARAKQRKGTQEKSQELDGKQSTSQEEVNYLFNLFSS